MDEQEVIEVGAVFERFSARTVRLRKSPTSLGRPVRPRISTTGSAIACGSSRQRVQVKRGASSTAMLRPIQFIVDDGLDSGLRKATRTSLLSGWVERKIRRDLVSRAPNSRTPRASVDPTLDMADYVARMMELMENVAGLVAEAAESGIVLRESIEADAVRGEARKIFEVLGEQIVAILLTSVLVSHGPRQGRSLRVSFVLRTFQEYFTALHLLRRGQRPDAYPPAVKTFHDELTVARP